MHPSVTCAAEHMQTCSYLDKSEGEVGGVNYLPDLNRLVGSFRCRRARARARGE